MTNETAQNIGKGLAKQNRQRRARIAIRLRLESIRSRANDALQNADDFMDMDDLFECLDDVKTDCQFALGTANALIMDKV